MESKINNRTRINIRWMDLMGIYNNYFSHVTSWSCDKKFCEDTGLVITSTRIVRGKGYTYYFKIVDKQKFMLARLKYGI